jgi:hypothetical protein
MQRVDQGLAHSLAETATQKLPQSLAETFTGPAPKIWRACIRNQCTYADYGLEIITIMGFILSIR